MMTAADRQEMRDVFDEAVRAGLEPLVKRIAELEEAVKHPLFVIRPGPVDMGCSTDPNWNNGACSNGRKE